MEKSNVLRGTYTSLYIYAVHSIILSMFTRVNYTKVTEKARAYGRIHGVPGHHGKIRVHEREHGKQH
jgi:hypothetical protein